VYVSVPQLNSQTPSPDQKLLDTQAWNVLDLVSSHLDEQIRQALQ
jgi:hypothetical protein